MTARQSATREFDRMAELTFTSSRRYGDPLGEIEVDVVFTARGSAWRVPAFWRGGSRWSVRFAPPTPGRYRYAVETTDPDDSSLHGRTGSILIHRYQGTNPLFRHGNLRVSANGRHFEHADGTPFFWLGEAWYSGLSTRLSWAGFKKMTRDRKEKGFTVIETNAGLAVTNEEDAPDDPPFRNEGGAVWTPEFGQINPRFFDYADRRIQHLLDEGMVPAIIGAWNQVLEQMGERKLRQHWRYVIARYSAFPVFWIIGGQVYDPPPDQAMSEISILDYTWDPRTPGWTEITRYVRATDPYRHPLTVHEGLAPLDTPIADESLKDFDLFYAGHNGWPSLATAITQLNLHYSRRTDVKPLVVGEIGYEGFASTHHEDFQRAAFWLSMLNGAAGYTYGTIETAMFPTADQPFSRVKYSFYSWEESMHFPGSRQVSRGAALLRIYRWWEFEPHPDWVSPAGTTLLEPHDRVNGFDIDLGLAFHGETPRDLLPLGEWSRRKGTWRLPYAAGIAGEVRVVYLPYLGRGAYPTPTVLGLEPDSQYLSFYWEASLGIRVDLGIVECRADGTGRIDLGHRERKVYDADGGYRGEVSGTVWDEYGTRQSVEDYAYTPERPPTIGDWVLVLEALSP